MVGIAFSEHGGKTGRAMIKYPLCKKNNSRKNTLTYPGLTTVSFDRIINLCPTTMFWHVKDPNAIVTTCSWTHNLLTYYMMCL